MTDNGNIISHCEKDQNFVDAAEALKNKIIKNKFDLLSSNGLNIYEPDKNKVLKLYKSFFNALKKNGKLVTSYIGYPPTSGEESEWDFENINQEDMRRSLAIFASVLGAIWQNFTTKKQMIAMLVSVY